MLRATETGDRPSCSVDDGLEAVKQAGRKTSQYRITRERSPTLYMKVTLLSRTGLTRTEINIPIILKMLYGSTAMRIWS